MAAPTQMSGLGLKPIGTIPQMAEMPDPKPDSSGTTPPTSMAQTTPKGVRSYDEMNTGLMVFELQGTVGELKEAIAAVHRTLEATLKKVELSENTSKEIKGQLTALTPKIDDLVGFTKHGVPNLASKQDISDLKAEIEKRPTRRQAILDIAWVVGLITAAVTFGSKIAH